MVYSLLRLNAENTQIILLDSRQSDGPFTIAWSHVFTSSHRLLDIRQLKSKIQKQSGNKNARLCFKRAVWGIHGGISPLHRGGTSRTRCKDAPLLHAFKDFMIGRMRTAVFGKAENLPWRSLKVPKMHQVQIHREMEKLEHKLLADSVKITEGSKMLQVTAAKASVITITYAIRSTPVHDAHAHGEANLLKYPQQHGFDYIDPSFLRQLVNSPKPISRQIQNDHEVQSRIRAAAQAWESQQRSQLRDIRVQFRAVNFGELSFIDQVALAQGTDFFIGPHGASFAHLLYLRQLPKAAVLELRPPTRNIGNEQFRNLAVHMHHLYEKIPYGVGSRKPNVNLRVSRSELKKLDSILQRILDTLLMARILKEGERKLRKEAEEKAAKEAEEKVLKDAEGYAAKATMSQNAKLNAALSKAGESNVLKKVAIAAAVAGLVIPNREFVYACTIRSTIAAVISPVQFQ
ncbi:hypothetical protein HDU81_004530 [Chytriomyces hyalinus]|nr:hypothetical protein HDU81_004530 [Chytriomyces hyalinus]